MKRVTGLGGVFFKTNDPKKIKDWYEKHLGMNMDAYGHSFRWKDLNNPDAKAPALTAWSPFQDDTTYFSPSEKEFMFNRNYAIEILLHNLTNENHQLTFN